MTSYIKPDVNCVRNKHGMLGSNTLNPQLSSHNPQFIWLVGIIYWNYLKIHFAPSTPVVSVFSHKACVDFEIGTVSCWISSSILNDIVRLKSALEVITDQMSFEENMSKLISPLLPDGKCHNRICAALWSTYGLNIFLHIFFLGFMT